MANAAVLSDADKSSVNTSISLLSTRLNDYFGSDVSNHFQFGSSTRGTNLPRSMDAHSDIDYMVVFAQGGSKPQTYMGRLKTFVEQKYSTSEIAQGSPTVVLSLNRVKIELAPALSSYGDYYLIPTPASPYVEWVTTTSGDVGSRLTTLNHANGSLIKPMIRLLKYWNAKNDYVFDSFSLEKWIVERVYYGCNTLRDYLFYVVEQLGVDGDAAQWKKDKVKRAKDVVVSVKRYESQGLQTNAEAEVKKLIPVSASALEAARERPDAAWQPPNIADGAPQINGAEIAPITM
jgi:hypothetical protein